MPTCYLKVTVQVCDGAEETVYETSTTSTSWVTREKAIDPPKKGSYNEKITVRFYIKTSDSSYPAQMANPLVKGEEICQAAPNHVRERMCASALTCSPSSSPAVSMLPTMPMPTPEPQAKAHPPGPHQRRNRGLEAGEKRHRRSWRQGVCGSLGDEIRASSCARIDRDPLQGAEAVCEISTIAVRRLSLSGRCHPHSLFLCGCTEIFKGCDRHVNLRRHLLYNSYMNAYLSSNI